MIYCFVDESTGETVDLKFPCGKAPRIGKVIRRNGRRLRRIFSGYLAVAQIAKSVWGWPFRSESLPRGCCPESQDAKGRPIIKSQAHEREVLARTGYERE